MKQNIGLTARLLLLAMMLGWLMPAPLRAADLIPLAGEWRFSLDPSDAGVKDQWFNRELNGQIKLPGVLQSQGYGDEITARTPWVLSLYDRLWYEREDYKAYTQPGRVKVPFLSQPPRHYLGAAWYQREIEIPQEWQGRRVVLNLERPHWETTIWIDERKIGSNLSLVAPHLYDLGQLAPGKHRLTVRIDNRLLMPYRPDAHSVSDSLAGSWNGIVGKIELQATSPVWIDDAQVFPNVVKKSALIKVQVGNMTGLDGKGTLSAGGVTAQIIWDSKGGKAELEVPLGPGAQTWDEFHPVLQRLTLQLNGAQADDRRELVFGLRELRAEGNQFILNGRPIIFRGTHHGGDFPLTGYPPTDVEYWKKLIRICQSWGLNHIRFHSFCPPEAAFIAADELGFYLQPEPGMWNEISPGTPMERMLYEETERMTRAYGNHPSYLLLSPSNEPKGRWTQSLPRWAEHYRRADTRRLYTNGTGHTEKEVPNLTEGVDYLVVQRIGADMLRGNSAWFGRDYRDSLKGVNMPVLSHETGQWVAYPDYAIISKFTGYMRPGNYEIFRDSMAAHGLLERNRDFALASGRYQLECYKEEIEANLRTPGLGGFQLLDLHDYLGQGTALVGLLDAFWEEKGYATAKEFRRFCNTTVPLARLEKRVFTTEEQLDVEVEVAHYGERPLTNAIPYWKIVDGSGRTIAGERWPSRTIPLGRNISLGHVKADLSKLATPRAYKLVVGLQGTEFENDWDFWLYAEALNDSAPADVFVTKSWDEAEARLAAGRKVLYLPRNADLDWTSPPLDTVPVFWNRLMGPAWGRMLGIWANSRHPALAQFPTEANFDWQWAETIRNVRAVNLDRLPRSLQPIVQAIDDWNRNYKLGLLFECKVGRGRLMVSSFDIGNGADTNSVARQLRRSVLSYMASARFQPQAAVQPAQIRSLLFDTRVMHKLGAVAKAEAQPQSPASNAVDGDPNTFWQVGDPRKIVKRPHELTISFNVPVAMKGLVLMQRQNHREHEGDIREYVLAASDDGKEWREVTRGQLASTFDPQQVSFKQEVTARYLKLTALSGFGADTTSALAELAVIYTGPKLAGTEEGQLEYQRSKSATPDIDEGTNANQRPQSTPPKPRKRRRP
ncbi:MAG TPA: discoidin domain-containing protein [Pyrinomonadaceae bacterium]|jgi:hypothetical protein